MQGQFIFPTCNSAGLSLTALLRNTARDGSLSESTSNFGEIYCALKIFKAGILLFDTPSFCTIPAGGGILRYQKPIAHCFLIMMGSYY